MKQCPNCGAMLNDDAGFCTNCGMQFPGGQAGPGYGGPQQYYSRDPHDHTAEFHPADIAENKVICMAVYLLGYLGLILAFLSSNQSPYVAFHVRQALKIEVVNFLLLLIAILLAWTLIVPVLAGVCTFILFIVRIICFFQVCGNKAKEPPIVGSFGFLK